MVFPIFSRRVKDDSLILGRFGPLELHKFSISASDRSKHMYVSGVTGGGKSMFIQNCMLQDILAGRGCAVIDPHGDLAKGVLRRLISNGFFVENSSYDRIIYVDPTRRDYIVPYNVLEPPGPTTETFAIADRIITAFVRAWPKALDAAARFEDIMRTAVLVLVETDGTLLDVYKLLVDEDFRNNRLEKIKDPKVAMDCRDFFLLRFDRWRDKELMIESTLNKVNQFRQNPSTFYMLGQKENSLNLRLAMDEGKVVLFDLGGETNSTDTLLGTLATTGFEQAAKSRANVVQESRNPYYLYVDEFQIFATHPGMSGAFRKMLSEVRKFGLHMTLANQNISGLDADMRNALGNAQTIITFKNSPVDAEHMVPRVRRVDTSAIKRQGHTEVQHPVFEPVYEQRVGQAQTLTDLKVREAAIRTAGGRTATIWAEKVKKPNCTEEELEDVKVALLKRHGKPFSSVYKNLVERPYYEVFEPKRGERDQVNFSHK